MNVPNHEPCDGVNKKYCRPDKFKFSSDSEYVAEQEEMPDHKWYKQGTNAYQAPCK